MTEETWLWPIRIVTGLLSAALLLAGTAFVIGIFFVRPSSHTSTFVAPVHRVQVDSDDADVEIQAGRPGSPSTVYTRLRSAFRTATHHESVTGGVLTVAGSCQGTVMFDNCSVGFTIVVPPGTSVQLTTHSGDVTVIGTGSTTVHSTDGDLRLIGVHGTIQLATHEGDITGKQLTGPTVTTSSSNGDVRLSFAAVPKSVQVQTGNGDVRIAVPTDEAEYQVTATTNGDQEVTVPRAATGGSATGPVIGVTSRTGDIQISPAQ